MKGIRHMTSAGIEHSKWDECLYKSDNSLIYAQFAYLNCMAENWDALIYGDYEAVMPLPFSKRLGFRLLYQPNFSQQLGVFGNHVPTEIFRDMINMARHAFPYADLNLNFGNTYLGGGKKNNYIIPLAAGYDHISASYHNDLRKNLKRSSKFGLEYVKEGDPDRVITSYGAAYGKRFPHIRKTHYEALLSYCSGHNDQVIVRRVLRDEKPMAEALLLKDDRRLYFLFSVVSDEGRDMEANHFLVDRLLREFSGKSLIFDFEGSDIPGIADFYKNFGAVNQPYTGLNWNDLPWPVRLFKR